MAVNLASKYSSKVDERFTLKSLTESFVSQEYEFDGVKSINVYSIDPVQMVAYTRSGMDRYGTVNELSDTFKTYTLTQDRAFTFSIDRGNRVDSMMVREAGRALAMQQDEIVTPEIDIYRIATWSAAAVAALGKPATATPITTTNAYSSFLQGQAYLDENKVPIEGRFAFVTPTFYNMIKLDQAFTKASDSAYKDLRNGQVGDIDGVRIIKAPSTYFPAATPFLIAHKSTMVSPKKLTEYKIHENPRGINGNVVEGRIYYDAFVLEQKKKGVFVWKEA